MERTGAHTIIILNSEMHGVKIRNAVDTICRFCLPKMIINFGAVADLE